MFQHLDERKLVKHDFIANSGKKKQVKQMRIQDSQRQGQLDEPGKDGTNLLFGNFFPKNRTKKKEMLLRARVLCSSHLR